MPSTAIHDFRYNYDARALEVTFVTGRRYLYHDVPPGAAEPRVAEAEAVRAFWASPSDILAELEAGRAHAIFPTRRNLERLALFSSIAEARADAARHPVRKITPWVEEHGGQRFITIPEGIGFPVTREKLEGLWRG